MLRSYFPLYQIARRIEELRYSAELLKDGRDSIQKDEAECFADLMADILDQCTESGFVHTAGLVKRAIAKPPPKKYAELFSTLEYVNDSLSEELEREAIFSIHQDRKRFFNQPDLFGPEVAAAFPSCARDIQRAGSCYALEQEDACVHHLMLVLERGLHALATKVGVPYQPANWQTIINDITGKLNTLPHAHPERNFYRETNTQFGFLKVAYRNHSEHSHDDAYDIEKALHILNHVRDFMQALTKGGLSE